MSRYCKMCKIQKEVTFTSQPRGYCFFTFFCCAIVTTWQSQKAVAANSWIGELLSFAFQTRVYHYRRPHGGVRRWTNAGLMLGHRLRRWPNIKPALVSCLLGRRLSYNNAPQSASEILSDKSGNFGPNKKWTDQSAGRITWFRPRARSARSRFIDLSKLI